MFGWLIGSQFDLGPVVCCAGAGPVRERVEHLAAAAVQHLDLQYTKPCPPIHHQRASNTILIEADQILYKVAHNYKVDGL